MRITSTTSPRPRSGRALTRALAATAGLGLALSLTACTIGEAGDDDDTAAATTQQTSTSDSSAPAETPAGDNAPTVGIDALVLTAADAPELGLQPLPAEEITGGLSAIGDITAGVQIEPEHCADFNTDALLVQAQPGTMAIQSGEAGSVIYAVAVSTLPDGLPDRAVEVESCPVITLTMPFEGMEMVTETSNVMLDLDAPDGVRDFAAIRQDSATDAMGQSVTTGSLVITGSVRGIGVSVTATSPTAEITPEAEAVAMDTFTKQVAKIRDAT